ncbi:TPA: PAAR domain-containing protein [Stenotrophomonas maltophilia]|nr:PAAR domain-containing protein [Stenotrophomonas maltophilia]HEL4290470.1 PAAR domain-containing protein [Stenotrophomonas maltophilia]
MSLPDCRLGTDQQVRYLNVRRHWIVVGDTTSSSGRVINGSPCTDIEGRAVAREGDSATCPLHQGVFPIIEGEPTLIIDGHPVALHGHRLACGCQLVSTQQRLVYVSEAPCTAAPSTIDVSTGSSPRAAICLECLLTAGTSGAPLLVRS